MRTRNISVSEDYVPTINLGRQGENEVSQVVFDVSDLISDYGAGEGVVVVRRPNEITTYQHDDTVQSGDTVTWTVSSADTEIAGDGNVQLFWMVDDAVAKTITYQTYVESALMNPTDAPVSNGGWITDEIGNLDDLTTSNKDDLVSAINEIASGVTSGLTNEIRQALLQIAEKVAYIDEDGQDYYDDLYDALYAVSLIRINARSISLTTIGGTSQLTATTVPEGANVTWTSSDESVATVNGTGLVTSTGYGSAIITATAGSKSATCSVMVSQVVLVNISAVYTPSGTVYDSDTLDSLKSDLVVTALWDNGTTSEVPSSDYTLSGTLNVGTNTITVSYGGKETTFTVTVVGLVSISAVYTQSGTVYDTDTLDSLKADLVVTAHYDDQTAETVTTYTLSGTLTVGTSTITVSYGGKTTTFEVAVTQNTVITGYTRVGTPTIDGNNFTPSANGYIKTSDTFSPVDNSWAIRLKITSGSTVSSYQNLFRSVDSSNAAKKAVFIQARTTGYKVYISSDDSSTDIINGQEITINANTTTHIEVAYDGSNTYTVKTSSDGETWTTEKTVTSSSKIYGGDYIAYGGPNSGTTPYSGLIYLDTLKIYIGGSLWWQASA